MIGRELRRLLASWRSRRHAPAPAPLDWQRIQDLLNEALELPSRERLAFVASACSEDVDLHKEVASLLAAHARAGVLDRPAADLATGNFRLALGSFPTPRRITDRSDILDEEGHRGKAVVWPATAPVSELDAGQRIGHYEIIEEIGAGGMGVVYKARDTRLDRIVAIKSLPSLVLADDEARRRVVREARTAAAVNHPSIATTHAVEEYDDALYIVMELVDGSTMAALTGDRRPDVDTCIELVAQAAEGLGAAHARGIVHRDIKPSNVLVTVDGRVKITDFGIARQTARVELVTRTAGVAGTLAYMSPEQAEGEPPVPQADVWSLGGVLFTLLTGEPPFGRGTELALRHRLLTTDPPFEQLPGDLPSALTAVVRKAMARNPEDRFGSGSELAVALRNLQQQPAVPTAVEPVSRSRRRSMVVAVAALTIVVLLGVYLQRQSSVAGPDPTAAELRLALANEQRDSLPSLAVLSFVDMSPNRDQEYFSDGITEELLNTMARIRKLRVLVRTSVFAYKGENKDVSTIGTELGVGYIVKGSVRKDGERLRITAQLIAASDGAHLWSEQYDRDMGDVFAIQTEIAEAIAAALRVPLGLEEGERLVSPTDDLEAYDLYLEGRARMRERGESVLEAIALFEAAIARDSNWAPPWAGLAESRSLVPYYRATGDSAVWANSLDAAEAAARRALALEPKSASAIVALGNVHRDRWNWDEAETSYLRALTLDPENVEAHQQYAEFLSYIGRRDEAYRAGMRALSLDRSPIRLNIAGYLSLFDGRTREGIELLSEAIRADPQGGVHPDATANLRWAHLQASDWSGYRSLLLEYFDARYAATGDERYANRARELSEAWPAAGALTREVAEWITTHGTRRDGAMMFVALGEPDRALEALEFYIDYPGHSFGARQILFRPEYDELIDEPRFQAILTANGLEGRRPPRIAAAASPVP